MRREYLIYYLIWRWRVKMKSLLKGLLLLAVTVPTITITHADSPTAIAAPVIKTGSLGTLENIPNYKEFDLTRKNQTPVTKSSCDINTKIGFSATGNSHVSAAGSTLLGYATTYTNTSINTNNFPAWISGGSTFIAPCTGMYVFAISFVKDSYYYGGTTDDVNVNIYQNGVNKGRAWAGEGGGNRETGAYTVVLNMNANDWVQTFVSSDGGPTRHLAQYNFSGFFLKP
jgi:hypothetical protein